MAKVKLPLEMANGVMARTIGELRDNFDIKKVVGHFLDGKLKNWLEVRYYEEELEKVNELSESDPELAKKLCEILGVEYTEENIDIDSIQEKNERLLKLKQYTDDEEIIANIDSVAFNQEELAGLLEQNASVIYLYGQEFFIPLSKESVKYIGINNPKVLFSLKGEIDLEQKNIQFINVEFFDEYKEILNRKNAKDITKDSVEWEYMNYVSPNIINKLETLIYGDNLERADRARYLLYELNKYMYGVNKYTSMNLNDELHKASKNGYLAAQIRYALDFEEDKEKLKSFREEIFTRTLNEDEKKDPFVIYEYAIDALYDSSNVSSAINLLKKSAEMGNWIAEKSLAQKYEEGYGVEQNYAEANKYLISIGEKGIAFGYYLAAWNLLFVLNDKTEKALEWFEKAFSDTDFKEGKLVDLKNRIKKIPDVQYKFGYGAPYNRIPLTASKHTLESAVEKSLRENVKFANGQFSTSNSDFLKYLEQLKDDYIFKNKLYFVIKVAEKDEANLQIQCEEEWKCISNNIKQILTDMAPNFDYYDYVEVGYEIKVFGFPGLFDEKKYMLDGGLEQILIDLRKYTNPFNNKVIEYYKTIVNTKFVL